jgi:hypothetical protein
MILSRFSPFKETSLPKLSVYVCTCSHMQHIVTALLSVWLEDLVCLSGGSTSRFTGILGVCVLTALCGIRMAHTVSHTPAQHLPWVGLGSLCAFMCEWPGPWPRTCCSDSAPRWLMLQLAWRDDSYTHCGDCCHAMMTYCHQIAALNRKVTFC